MAAKSVTRILQEARELILDPKHWTRGQFARRTKRSGPASVMDPKATCFCAVGATMRASGGSAQESALDYLRRAIKETGGEARGRITVFNDRPGRKVHTEVIAAFDEAIKLSKSRKKVTA